MGLGVSINNVHVEPGGIEAVNLHVGKLPSGTRISIKTHIYCSQNEGPTVLLLAGLHGDEINGVEILRRVIAQGLVDNLLYGNVIVVPILNVYGFINFSREVPDGKDVNRSFPGSLSGSLASRVARILTKKVLPSIDFGIDFHTGGDNRYNYPQVRYFRKDDRARALAHDFGAPYLLEKGLIPKSFRKAARDMGIPIIVYEGGEALRLDGFSIDTAVSGIQRLLYRQGFINDQPRSKGDGVSFRKSTWIRAKQAGIFIWSKKSGTQIMKGEVLGSILDPSGGTRTAVTASRDGHILGHNNTPVVHQGDALFHIGYDWNK